MVKSNQIHKVINTLWLYARQPGRVFKKNYKRPDVRKFSRISAKCLFLVLFNRLKVLHLHLELPSDQENKNGFEDEGLWFLGRKVDLTL